MEQNRVEKNPSSGTGNFNPHLFEMRMHSDHYLPHGDIGDLSQAIKQSKNTIESFVGILPKTPRDMWELSKEDEVAKKTFLELVRQSFRYMDTIAQLQNEMKSDPKSDDATQANQAQGRTHNATIDSINIWSRALARADIDNDFLSGVVTNRASYGLFAMGLAASIYTDSDLYKELTD